MRLLVVSHTRHFMRGSEIVGWGPTVRELDQLATLFDSVVHLAPMHPEEAPKSALPYQARNLRLRGVRPTGGHRLRNKLQVLAQSSEYIRAFVEEASRCDVVHIRAPANIALVTMLTLAGLRGPKKRWIKYAGNWRPDLPEAWSYRLQRWWLRHGLARSWVTVNGEWPSQPAHVKPFLNPCLTDVEVIEGRKAAADKAPPTRSDCRILFVGRADAGKGVPRLLDIVERARDRGIEATLDLVGEGPERAGYEEDARQRRLPIRFHGSRSRPDLAELYADAHFILLPSSSSEGWPKVLSEAMAYGAVPVASSVSSVPQYLERFGTGRALHHDDIDGYVRALEEYIADPDRWQRESRNATAAADSFSYRAYLSAVQGLLGLSQATA